jgi:hypothetical protein
LAWQRRSSKPIGPLARKATGMIVLPKGRSDKEVLEDALLEKHGMR